MTTQETTSAAAPTPPSTIFAIACPPKDGAMPWLCCVSVEHKVGGPALFSSAAAAQAFAKETNTDGAEPVLLSREQFYKLAGDALRDGLNVFAFNPSSKTGRFIIWRIAQLLDSLPRNEPCPCGSGERTKLCCAKPPEHRYTPRLWPVVNVRPATTESQGRNEQTNENFEEV